MKCLIPGCTTEQTLHRFPSPRTRYAEFKRWLEILDMDELYALSPNKLYDLKRICFAHFDASCKSPGNPRLHKNAVPTIGVPVIQRAGVREFVKGFDPSIFNNDTTANSKKSSVFDDYYASIISSKPVESSENDLETQLVKLFEEPDVTPAPILFVSSSTDHKEEVLKTSNKQSHTDGDPLTKRIVQKSRCTGQCKDLESPTKRDRNCKNCILAMNEVTVLRKKVNILQNRNRRLDRRVKSMKTLLRHFKKTHGR